MNKKIILILLAGLLMAGCEHELWKLYLSPNDVVDFSIAKSGAQTVDISYQVPQMDIFEVAGETDEKYSYSVCLYYAPAGTTAMTFIDKLSSINPLTTVGSVNTINNMDLASLGLLNVDYTFTVIVRDMYNQPSKGVSKTITW